MSVDSNKFIVTTFKFSRKKFSELKNFLSRYGLSLSALFNVTLDFWLSVVRAGDFDSVYSDFLKKYEGPEK